MKLIIQIPCYNEEATLGQVIADLPRRLPGVDEIEYLVIDDGSSDRTIDVAREHGVHHILPLGSNHGLATAFTLGLRRGVELGADIIVNTDGDNQYAADCIEDLIKPIQQGRADIVVGARPIEEIHEFSWLKKRLQRLGSGVVQRFSGTKIADTTSGFRAYSADAAMQLEVFNRYTYTLETIIQAGAMHMRIMDVPIRVNAKTRESRLISTIPRYISRSGSIILRSYLTYKPLRMFFYLSLVPGLIGLLLCGRWLLLYGSGHYPSLIIAAVLLIISFMTLTLGILSDLISANRRLLQHQLFLQRKSMWKRDDKGA